MFLCSIYAPPPLLRSWVDPSEGVVSSNHVAPTVQLARSYYGVVLVLKRAMARNDVSGRPQLPEVCLVNSDTYVLA